MVRKVAQLSWDGGLPGGLEEGVRGINGLAVVEGTSSIATSFPSCPSFLTKAVASGSEGPKAIVDVATL
jgi:hypothetical protein